MEPSQQSSKNKKTGIGIAIGVIAIAALIAVMTGEKKTSDEGVVDTTAATDTTTTGTDVSPSSYKDGTYSATGSYMSPGGRDELFVTLAIKNNIVTTVTATAKPGDETSAYYEDIFVKNFKPFVVGKDIATLKLDKVSGSSLTPKGFNDAVSQIKKQAQV